MLASLDSLAALPGITRVCCTHEYTLSNLRFARAVEPDNAALASYEKQCIALRANGQYTLPSSIALELEINPFLRSRERSVIQAVRLQTPQALSEVAQFAALREWKNNFR
jgi:hydroxyacylglutathione hydrolase